MKKVKKIISVLLAVMMVAGVYSAVPFTAGAEVITGAVTYLDENGVQQTVASGDYTPVTSSVTQWTSGTYVAVSNVSFSDRITISGSVRLILCDGFTVNANDGVNVSGDNSLTICAQSRGSGMGILNATASRVYYSGLGGGNKENCSTITINGGKVTATGNSYGAGIGGGYNGTGGNITINGGDIEANGGNYGAGIGGGITGTGNNITINDGEVEANGGSFSAGIGVGSRGAGGSIAINGGKVEANKGDYGVGVGGSNGGAGGTISLGCAGAEDSVYASSYNGTVSVADGQTLTDGTATYSGELDSGQITAIAGKTLANAYRIILPASTTGGTVTADKSIVAGNAQDKTVTLTVTPNENYVVRYVRINGTDLQPQNGVYSFTMPSEDVTVTAEFAVPETYIDEHGETQTIVDYTVPDGTETTLNSGWYIVKSHISYTSRLTVSGDVHLILGNYMDAQQGIRVPEDSSLTIYAKSADSLYVLNADASGQCSGIGGEEGYGDGTITINGGTITINGGVVTATGGDHSAGINGTVTINGGVVTATGGDGCPGIGSLPAAGEKTITINGGNITATGGNNGAGIGGSLLSRSGKITINGGTINATGNNGGAGIGGGDGSGADVEINGGTVNAGGGTDGAGIGKGSMGDDAVIAINGGKVTANGIIGIGEPNMDTSAIIFLSYTNATDTIFASSFRGNVLVKNGKSFTDGTNTYIYGTPSETFEALTNVTLTPADAYNVTVSECANGTVTASPAKAFAGETITLTVTPDEGYEIKNVKYNGNQINTNIDVYSFTLPNENVTVTAEFAIPVAYIDEHGDTQSTVDYTVLDGTETELGSGWYVADGSLTYTNEITIGSDVHLILRDGCVLNAKKGINVTEYICFTIYAQSTGNSMGVLNATGSDLNAGIGEGYCCTLGTITINGGKITAQGGLYCPGIGGAPSSEHPCGAITINGGEVTATGGRSGAGIGSGSDGSIETITINGGKITATGGRSGAGIGSGSGGSVGTITINGGEVTAVGGETEGNGISGETVTLSYMKATDYIFATSYSGTINPVSGKDLTDDNGNIYYFSMANEVFTELTNTTLTPADAHKVTVSGDTDGAVTVPARAFSFEAVSITVNKGYAVTGVTVDGTALTPVNGVYSFEMPYRDVTVSVSCGLIGDINRDGKVNIKDVTAIQRHLADLKTIPAQYLAFADTDGDGDVTINDATTLQKYLAEFYEALPCQSASPTFC